MGNALSNFGAGALSGYRDVLGMKMKEDALAKRDEAQANRQANLEKLRFEREKPYKDASLELEGARLGADIDYKKDSLQLQREQMQQQAADRAAARGEAAAARRDAAAFRDKQYQLQVDEASGKFATTRAENEVKADAIKVNAFASSLQSRPLKPGEDPNAPIVEAAVAKSFGIKDAEGLSKLGKNDGALSFVREVTKESLKSAEETIKGFGQDQEAKIEYATKNLQYSKKKGEDVDLYIKQKTIEQNLTAAMGSPISSKRETQPEGPKVLNEVVFNQLVKDRASLTPGSPGYDKAKSVYEQLTPEDKQRVDQSATQYSPGFLSGPINSLREQQRKTVEQTRAEQRQSLPKW